MKMRLGAARMAATFLAAASPARAGQIPELVRFETWMNTKLPHASFKRVPDPDHPGVLYAGRVGEFETIVRVWVTGNRMVEEKVEVELPSERKDDIALSIIARFFRDFTGIKRNEEELWRQVQAMRGTIIHTGRKEASADFLGAHLSLYLDTQPNHDLIDPERSIWGTLYWRGEAKRLGPRKR